VIRVREDPDQLVAARARQVTRLAPVATMYSTSSGARAVAPRKGRVDPEPHERPDRGRASTSATRARRIGDGARRAA